VRPDCSRVTIGASSDATTVASGEPPFAIDDYGAVCADPEKPYVAPVKKD
jgi:hypothetical protein